MSKRDKMIKALEKLNKSGILGEDVDIKKAKKYDEEGDLIKFFCKSVEAVPVEKEEELDDSISDLYNELINESGETEEDDQVVKKEDKKSAKKTEEKKPVVKKTEEKKPAKKEEKKPVKKEEKKPVKKEEKKPAEKGKGPLGSRIGSTANILDEALVKGGTIEEIAKVGKVTTSRVHSHISHLTGKKKIAVTNKDGNYKVSLKKK
jgi:hypothetical protein